MKKCIYAILLICFFIGGLYSHRLYKLLFPGFEPVLPTVFYLGRNHDIPDMLKILNVAGDAAFRNDMEWWGIYDNLIVVDESDFWTVCFCPVGNGRTKNNASFYDDLLPLYIRKSDFSVIKDRPVNAINFVPGASYLVGDAVPPWEKTQ